MIEQTPPPWTQTITFRREAAYPSVGDQLDVIWKLLAEHPELLTDEAAAMLARVQAVKAKYPKT